MITTLSAYKEMILSTAGTMSERKSLRSEGNKSGGVDTSSPVSGAVVKSVAGAPADAVSVELSASHDVFSAVDNFFNLGKSGRFDGFHKLSPEDKEQFVKIVAALAQSGYVGYEELVVNNKVERHDVVNQIGDDRLRGARLSNDIPHTKR